MSKRRINSSVSRNIDDIIHEQVQHQDSEIDKLFREELEKAIFHPDSNLNRDMEEMARAGVAHKPVKYKDPLEYSPEEFENFKRKLGHEIAKDGLSCDDINRNGYYINYVKKYIMDNFIHQKNKNILRRTTYKLGYVDLGKYNRDQERIHQRFPIVQEYLGHFLVRITYFAERRDAFNILSSTIVAATVPVKVASIIVL